MDSLVLAPQKRRFGLVALAGVVLMILSAGSLWPIPDTLSGVLVPGSLFLLGLGVSGARVYDLLTMRPSFTADRYGFSVKGRLSTPWGDFIDARPVESRIGPLPVGTRLAIRTKEGKGTRVQTIAGPALSAPAPEMAEEITDYARMVRMQDALDAARASAARTVPPVTPEALAARPGFVPLPSASDPAGRTRRRRTLSERLFGRKPVI